jgi:hypothetical protein
MSSNQAIDEEAVAAADKEMEERANRAKDLLSQRYKGLKTQQVRAFRFEFMRLDLIIQDSKIPYVLVRSTHHSLHSIFTLLLLLI